MTVIVGVLCDDGVVVGSDSSASLGAGGAFTVEQPVKKVFTFEDRFIMAGTGHCGLCQRFEFVIEGYMGQVPNYHEQSRHLTSKNLSAGLIADSAQTKAALNLGAIVAFQSADGFQLCEYEPGMFQPEFKSPKQWFSTMGSGQGLTDPLMGMLRRVFFDGKQPSLNEGIFAVTWALSHAIELNTGGIGGPIQIAVLENGVENPQMTARILAPDELAEHEGNVLGMEQHIAEYRNLIGGNIETDSEPPPSPPPPPPT